MAPHKAVSSDLQRAYWDRYSDIATPVEVRHAHTTQFIDTQQKNPIAPSEGLIGAKTSGKKSSKGHWRK